MLKLLDRNLSFEEVTTIPNGSGPVLGICITADTILNFDVVATTIVTCEQGFMIRRLRLFNVHHFVFSSASPNSGADSPDCSHHFLSSFIYMIIYIDPHQITLLFLVSLSVQAIQTIHISFCLIILFVNYPFEMQIYILSSFSVITQSWQCWHFCIVS